MLLILFLILTRLQLWNDWLQVPLNCHVASFCNCVIKLHENRNGNHKWPLETAETISQFEYISTFSSRSLLSTDKMFPTDPSVGITPALTKRDRLYHSLNNQEDVSLSSLTTLRQHLTHETPHHFPRPLGVTVRRKTETNPRTCSINLFSGPLPPGTASRSTCEPRILR